jgi:hypothetical protein
VCKKSDVICRKCTFVSTSKQLNHVINGIHAIEICTYDMYGILNFFYYKLIPWDIKNDKKLSILFVVEDECKWSHQLFLF